uniref:Uncharacterized protein n=1 Tax=Gracilinema caldarium TaxID=215591 RepID=A0A7C3E250_9SPIR
MTISVKKALALTILTAALAMPGFSQNIEDLQSGAESMAKALSAALPFNSTLGLNWSDAYIGQLLGVPPHFGVGVSAGATTVKADEMKTLLTTLGVDTGVFPVLIPIPAAVAEARIGGFLLPFDIGVKGGYIPPELGKTIKETTGGLNLDYLAAGADIRFALLKGGLLLPRVSLGVGVNYMKGGLGTTISGGQSFTYTYGSDTYAISASDPELGISWETTTVDLKAQISKGFLIFTPYAGLGASYGMSKAGYYVKSDITATKNNQSINPQDLIDLLKANNITPPDISATGISSYFANNGWAFRAFGGLSLNILVLRVDVTGLYNLSDNSYGGSVGVRFQL